MKLTKTILRRAAALISPGDAVDNMRCPHFHIEGDDYEFMCFAVNAAVHGEGTRVCDEDTPAVQAFALLLREHCVSVGGFLLYEGEKHAPYTPDRKGSPESQAIRFDFLNLLAEAA